MDAVGQTFDLTSIQEQQLGAMYFGSSQSQEFPFSTLNYQFNNNQVNISGDSTYAYFHFASVQNNRFNVSGTFKGIDLRENSNNNTLTFSNLGNFGSSVSLSGTGNTLNTDGSGMMYIDVLGNQNTLNLKADATMDTTVFQSPPSWSILGNQNQVNIDTSASKRDTFTRLGATAANNVFNLNLNGNNIDRIDMTESGASSQGLQNRLVINSADNADVIYMDTDIDVRFDANGDCILTDRSSGDEVTVKNGVNLTIWYMDDTPTHETINDLRARAGLPLVNDPTAVIDGVTGPSGTTGPTGTSGSSGTSGPGGTTGTTGTSGASGPGGTTGATGTSGPGGTTGATGTSGPGGTTGATGTSGPGGTTGTTGTSGASGPVGTTGASGTSKKKGDDDTELLLLMMLMNTPSQPASAPSRPRRARPASAQGARPQPRPQYRPQSSSRSGNDMMTTVMLMDMLDDKKSSSAMGGFFSEISDMFDALFD